ncbi:Uncharacterized protein GBIM_12091 [Gryllus bimaculatus]|nr:Uncharacterized protein GBIM_12091 [Gryllus bimaculatus]
MLTKIICRVPNLYQNLIDYVCLESKHLFCLYQEYKSCTHMHCHESSCLYKLRLLLSSDPPSSAREDAPVKLRARSNSAESWAATGSAGSGGRAGRGPSDRSPLGSEPQRHKAVRQDSYLAAVRTPLGSTDLGNNRLKRQAALLLDEDEEFSAPLSPTPIPIPGHSPPVLSVRAASPPPPTRPTHLPILNPLCPAEPMLPMDTAATDQLLDDTLTGSHLLSRRGGCMVLGLGALLA